MTRFGVSCSPSRSGSSPMNSRRVRTAASARVSASAMGREGRGSAPGPPAPRRLRTQPAVEPRDHLAEAMLLEVGWTAAAHAVARGCGIAHEAARDAEELERGEDLLALLDVATQVALAVDDQRRRLHSREVLDGAAFPAPFPSIPRSA